MMSALDCYKEYIALRNHFTTPSYNYFKYQGKVNVNASSFDARKDKLFFQKLAKHPDVHNFLVANLSKNEKAWIRDLAYSEEAEYVYKDWLRRNQSLTYFFKTELKNLAPTFDNNFKIEKNSSHPYLLKLLLGNHISLETVCILLDLSGAKKYWDSKMEYDPVYQEIKNKIEKYSPFIKYDRDKMKKIVLDYYSQ